MLAVGRFLVYFLLLLAFVACRAFLGVCGCCLGSVCGLLIRHFAQFDNLILYVVCDIIYM